MSEGDVLELPVLFLGSGVQLLRSFVETLQALGHAGLHRGEGRFDLVALAAEDPAGRRVCIWEEGRSLDRLAPPICDAAWWVDRGDAPPRDLRFEFLTPARLLRGGKPLFRADFRQIFPFILRRVTSMLYAHCGVEVVDDPAALLGGAERVKEGAYELAWEDWHLLEGPRHTQELGGLMGALHLDGGDLKELWWILKLGSLLNLGKGAAFGAGRYRLVSG